MNEELTPQEMVFGNDLLLDKILKFVLHTKKGKILSIKTANRCKLVQKLWLDRVNATLQKIERSTIYLNTATAEGRRKIEKFIDTFAHSPAQRIPPFDYKMECSPECWLLFSQELLCMSVQCLRDCGAGLIQLSITCFHGLCCPEGNPLNSLIHKMTLMLPNLHVFSITEECGADDGCSTDCVRDGRTMSLVEVIFGGCKCLQHFGVYHSSLRLECTHLEIDVNKLKLPDTITNMQFVPCHGQNYFDELFRVNGLPNLTVIAVDVRNSIVCKDIALSIAKKFCHQLKKCKIVCSHYPYCNTLPVVMEKLEEIFQCPDWQNDLDGGLETYFPALKEIDLCRLNYDMLNKWLETSNCITMENISVELKVDPEKTDSRERDALLLQQMVYLTNAFPNVTNLDIKIGLSEDMSSIQRLFQQMTHLQELKIDFTFHGVNERAAVNSLSAILLSIKPVEAADLSEQLDECIWRDSAIDCGPVPIKPILWKMQDLKVMSLYCRDFEKANLDIVVQYGFLQMANLERLYLHGFQVSYCMKSRLKEKGCFLWQSSDVPRQSCCRTPYRFARGTFCPTGYINNPFYLRLDL